MTTTLPATDAERSATDQATTTLPVREGAIRPRRQLRGTRREERLNLYAAYAVGLCVALLLFGRLAPFSGILGFIVVAYVVRMATYALLVSLTDDAPAMRDRVATALLRTAALVLHIGLFALVVFTILRGWRPLTHLNFFTQDMSSAGPLEPLTTGGIFHAIVGTVEQISIALVITIPLGLSCAVYLTQIGGRGSRLIRTVVEAMTALPSVVAGLFILATWVLTFGFQRSGLAASFAISVMMLPIIIRAAEVVLRLVPGNLREASEALGAPRWRTVWHVVLPTARSGLATSVILGTARGIGETSPVLLTAGYTTYLNADPTRDPMVSLPLATFQLVQSPQPVMISRGFGAAFFLLLLVVALFLLARLVGGRGPGQQGRRQAARSARRSARDSARFSERDPEPLPIMISAADTAPIPTGDMP
jgi:phosphate transport system permease protein